MKWMIGLAAVLAIGALAGPGAAQEAAPLAVGDKYSLSQFQGKSAVIVAWYPKALTGG
ncbi:MAG: hypothetical protein K0Q72_1343 [Armatimonadetes bacterium]|nr:hypothetical protein [Armatimonadota bacterium]